MRPIRPVSMHKKAQHFAEYMLVFIVFLVMAIIVITALGLIPDLRSGSMVRKSHEILSIGPVGITYHAIDSCGGYTLRLRNNNPQTIIIQSIVLNDETIFNGSRTIFSGLEEYFEGSTAYRNVKGRSYEHKLSIRVLDTQSASVSTLSYSDFLYGEYSSIGLLGKQKYLHQNILDEFCFADTTNHVYNANAYQAFGNPSLAWLPTGYPILSLDGNDDYVQFSTFADTLKHLTLEMVVWLNTTNQETGIFFKPNSILVSVKENVVSCTLFDQGNLVRVDGGPISSLAWHHLVCVYDGSKLVLYLDGSMSNGKHHHGSIDGNAYPAYLGTYTPESGKNTRMKIGYFSLSSSAMQQDVIAVRARTLLSLYPNQP